MRYWFLSFYDVIAYIVKLLVQMPIPFNSSPMNHHTPPHKEWSLLNFELSCELLVKLHAIIYCGGSRKGNEPQFPPEIQPMCSVNQEVHPIRSRSGCKFDTGYWPIEYPLSHLPCDIHIQSLLLGHPGELRVKIDSVGQFLHHSWRAFHPGDTPYLR